MGELSAEAQFNAGSSVLAKVLKLDVPPIFFRDNKEQTLSQQGEHLPLLIGRRRVAPLVGFTGATLPIPLPNGEISIPALIGLFTEGFDILEITYWEEGVHWLCVGPCQTLHMIWMDGKPVLLQPTEGTPFILNPANAPSGTMIPLLISFDLWSTFTGILDVLLGVPVSEHTDFITQILDEAFPQFSKVMQGVFYMYWGEPNQPINTRLDFRTIADKLGLNQDPILRELGTDPEALLVSSRWPRICYVHWDKRFLGTEPRWPTLEYEIECRPFNTGALIQSQRWLSRTPTAGNPFDIEDSGANPAHALYQVLTGEYPYGLGISQTLIDMPALEQLGIICENEHLPVNILAKTGVDAASQIADLLQDMGVTASHLGGKLFFEAARRPDVSSPPPTVPADMVAIPEADIEIEHSNPATRLVYTFMDERRRFRQSAVHIDDDGVSEAGNRVNEISTTMPTVTDEKTAQKVAQRRAAEALAGAGVFRMILGRSARNFRPGTMFKLEGWGLLRVLSVDRQTDSNDVRITAALDHYSVIDSNHKPEDVEGNDDLDTDVPVVPSSDLAYNWIEPPPILYAASMAALCFRIEANTSSQFSHVHGSPDQLEYFQIGNALINHAGGTINDAMVAGGPTIIDPGPVITIVGADLLQVLDLSEDSAMYRLGKQWALIDGEIWFVKSITALGSSQYRLDSIIRGRFHTDQDAHLAGAAVIIAPKTDLLVFHHPTMEAIVGGAYWTKSQPYNIITGQADISDQAPVERTMYGMDLAPMPVDNFQANPTTWSKNTYSTGNDIDFEWTYRVRNGAGAGAGEGLAGDPIGNTPPPDGSHLLEIFDDAGATLVRTVTQTGVTYNYTNADLLADFGGEPATLLARVRPIIGTRTNKTREITVTLV